MKTMVFECDIAQPIKRQHLPREWDIVLDTQTSSSLDKLSPRGWNVCSFLPFSMFYVSNTKVYHVIFFSISVSNFPPKYCFYFILLAIVINCFFFLFLLKKLSKSNKNSKTHFAFVIKIVFMLPWKLHESLHVSSLLIFEHSFGIVEDATETVHWRKSVYLDSFSHTSSMSRTADTPLTHLVK